MEHIRKVKPDGPPAKLKAGRFVYNCDHCLTQWLDNVKRTEVSCLYCGKEIEIKKDGK